MNPPFFWRYRALPFIPLLLSPIGWLIGRVTARRLARPGYVAPVPVICCGNATAGGAGKTTLALDIGRRLIARGVAVHFITRGYGGQMRTTTRVDPVRHHAADVGDEPLLLAAIAPTWVGADRAASARAAMAAGAQALVMDDGLQNPTLAKTLSLLVVDGGTGFGNGFLIPAGPLRERVADAERRCAAAVLSGQDATDAAEQLTIPILRARLRPLGGEAVAGRRVLGFAGIGFPGKFADSLIEAGADLASFRVFPDHHQYRPADLTSLHDEARKLDATLATTAKDAARLSADQRAGIIVLDVRLEWDDPAALNRVLDAAFSSPARPSPGNSPSGR